MGPTIFHSLREFVATYGYWAVAVALLCENAGIPVPGETTLLLASFRSLHIPGRARLGHLHPQRGISSRAALAPSRARHAALQYRRLDCRRGRDPVSMVEISPPAPVEK